MRFRSWLALALCACSTGILDEPGTHDETEEELTTSNRLSLNRLSLNRLSLNALSAQALSSGAAALAATEDGRELLTYVARCALPEGESVTAGGITYPGRLGLAPEWSRGACLQSCRHWVSACLLAHVNAKGVSVPISVRGPAPSLAAPSPSELSDYPVEEAGFYGDVFAGVDDLQMYACLGKGLVASAEASSYLDDRLCASTDQCGFTRTGVCAPGTEVPASGGSGSGSGSTSGSGSGGGGGSVSVDDTDFLPGEGACLTEGGPDLGYSICGESAATLSDLADMDSLWLEVVTVYLKH